MNANIPIIIVHTGDSFYLEPVLQQARKFNPDTQIFLISDSSTNHYDFVEHVSIDDYFASALKFKEVYRHLSINPYQYELFCFQRWFILLDFVSKTHISQFLCLDSDVMLYCKVKDVFKKWMDYDFTICMKEGPQYTLFKRDSLAKFCIYLYSHYVDKDMQKELEEWYKIEGISDMKFLMHYSRLPNVRVFDVAQVVDGTCFDHHMKVSQGFEMQGRLKRIYWQDGIPYGKEIATGNLVRFNALHFQGGIKHKLNQYIYRDLPLEKRICKNLLWWTNPKRLKSRFFELKKILSNRKMLVYFIQKRILWRLDKNR